ncbi:hypothetical protein N656DRAFT_4312 [Canariomyces notabilis]|uniref:Uncharacterized protein n=1 Tax=Canariomyces notabilis TaxID=2074819 RepID=A0AAN6TMW9_9PEZI|nr:hypothetical protein N656DRAFT_4312 [Canariomyces arenarius]
MCRNSRLASAGKDIVAMYYNAPLVCSLAPDLKTGLSPKIQISTAKQPLFAQIKRHMKWHILNIARCFIFLR